MSETLNVNVLVAAKDEYTRQLLNTIQQDVYDILKSVYHDSQEQNIRRKISYSNFQKELKTVPQWTSYKLDSKIKDLIKKYPFLMDLITAIFVSHVKILACVRLKSDNKSIKIKVPNLNTFLHKLLIKCCEALYYEPTVINCEKHKLMDIISISLEDTIGNQIPIEYILNEYLSGAFDDEPEIPIQSDTEHFDPEPDHELSDPESDLNSEDGECKNIPILPIKNRSTAGVSINKELPNEFEVNNESIKGNNLESTEFNEDENVTENVTENVKENVKENGTEKPKESVLNKSSKIDDSDDDYSDEYISGDDLSDEENQEKKSRSLF
jgi:hypothetical protein